MRCAGEDLGAVGRERGDRRGVEAMRRRPGAHWHLGGGSSFGRLNLVEQPEDTCRPSTTSHGLWRMPPQEWCLLTPPVRKARRASFRIGVGGRGRGATSGAVTSGTASLGFWFGFASTFSYFAQRVEREAAGVGVSSRPFLLGPLFH